MGGFFLCVGIMLFLIFKGLGEIGGRGINRIVLDYDKTQEAKEKGLDVIAYNYYSQTFKSSMITAKDSNSNQGVYQAKDIKGIKRWYYKENHKPCVHYNNSVLIKNFEQGKTKAIKENKKWFAVPNFWDMTTDNFKDGYLDSYRDCRTEEPPKQYLHGYHYFDDWHDPEYKMETIKNEYGDVIELSHHKYYVRTAEERKQYFFDNGNANVKVYVKNMRPYQLHYGYVYNKGKRNNQYYIRFMLEEKEHDLRYHIHAYGEKTNSDFWTKWYAITQEQYYSLSNQRRDADDLIQTKKLQKRIDKNSKVALNFKNDNKNTPIEQDELIWAFDEDGNFVGE